MRTGSLSILFAMLAMLISVVPGQAIERPHCEACQRIWIDSPCRTAFTIVFDRRTVEFKVCCPTCLYEVMEKYPEKEAQHVLILDYRERKDMHAALLVADKCAFLMGVDGDEEKSAPPYVLAFATLDAAKEAQGELGGEVCDWMVVADRCKRHADEVDPAPKPHREPIRKRGRKH